MDGGLSSPGEFGQARYIYPVSAPMYSTSKPTLYQMSFLCVHTMKWS